MVKHLVTASGKFFPNKILGKNQLDFAQPASVPTERHVGAVHWDEGMEPHGAVGLQECSLAERMPPKMGITGHKGNLKSIQEHEAVPDGSMGYGSVLPEFPLNTSGWLGSRISSQKLNYIK